MSERPVLVLDAELRHAVAIVRSLARRGVPVVAASSRRRFPAGFSRYVSTSVELHENAPVESLLQAVEEHRVDVLIPAGLPGNALLCRARPELEKVALAPYNELTCFEQLSNKLLTVGLARELGIRVPQTHELRSVDDASDAAELLGFPMVCKSPLDQGSVRYARDATELTRITQAFLASRDASGCRVYPLAQEYIGGDGHGFYGLAEHGELRAYFMHQRLHEVPPSGGPSAMAMSFRDPTLLEDAAKIFAATKWHGVAMVEFKKSNRDGAYYLIEVNPKFWGSLDLSISAGVDFPFLLYQMLRGAPADVNFGSYSESAKFRWLTMDLAYSMAARDLDGYFRRFRDEDIQDDFDARDPLPSAALFASGMARVARSTLSRANARAGVKRPDPLKTFYRLKPLIPRGAQIAARRVRARRIWERLDRQPTLRIPGDHLGYAWPGGARACLVLTHDVEGDSGQRNVGLLSKIEDDYDLRSCWNFVVRRYAVDLQLIRTLKQLGHEIGVHGVCHDGREFESRATFESRLATMEEAADVWGAVGFRSPSLDYDPELLREVRFRWDSSMAAWDPFQPRRGDCHRYVPFELNEHCIELPVTLWQDFTLFEELEMRSIDVWFRQADAIYEVGGLINVIVHPDYMTTPERLEFYRAFVEYLSSKDDLWIATPSQVAEWHRSASNPPSSFLGQRQTVVRG